MFDLNFSNMMTVVIFKQGGTLERTVYGELAMLITFKWILPFLKPYIKCFCTQVKYGLI